LQNQLREAGRARAEGPTSSRGVERIRELVFGGDQRDSPLPYPFRVYDGAADRRRVQVMVQRVGLRHGHDEARQRHRQGLPFAFPARREIAKRPRRVRLRPGEDRGEEETVDRAADLGLAETSVQHAREHLRARFVHRPLSALRRAGRGFGFTSSVRAVEGSCRILPDGRRYVP